MRSLLAALSLLAFLGCGCSQPAHKVDREAAELIVQTLAADSEFSVFDADFIVAKIDDLEAGAAAGYWTKDALGEWGLVSGAPSDFMSILTVQGDISLKISVPVLKREVVSVLKVDAVQGQSRSVAFTWRYTNAPQWLDNAPTGGSCVLEKDQFEGWKVKDLKTWTADSSGHLFIVKNYS